MRERGIPIGLYAAYSRNPGAFDSEGRVKSGYRWIEDPKNPRGRMVVVDQGSARQIEDINWARKHAPWQVGELENEFFRVHGRYSTEYP